MKRIPEPLFVGCISGTSLDGLDVAIMRFQDGVGYPDLLGAATYDFPDSLHQKLARLTSPGTNEVYELGQAHVLLGRFIGEKVNQLLESEKISSADVRAIGSHGQTIRHHPEVEAAFTLQIGDPDIIAEVTGIETVANFRGRDMAAGGQGAPLACAYHRYLFAHPNFNRALVNLGGMANITLLCAEDDRVIGFDTGPGNRLMDIWCRLYFDKQMDYAGNLSAQGRPLPELLSACLQDEYFQRKPPKSTGREYFNQDWLEQKMVLAGVDPSADPKNILTTLAHLTAQSVALTLTAPDYHSESVWVCGGGRYNNTIMSELFKLCGARPIEDSGMDGDFIEAGAFAWLARERLAGRPGNIPEVTGAAGRRVLGSLYSA